MESRMHGNSHVRFGERDEETHLLAGRALHPYSTILERANSRSMAPSVSGTGRDHRAGAAKRPQLASGPPVG